MLNSCFGTANKQLTAGNDPDHIHAALYVVGPSSHSDIHCNYLLLLFVLATSKDGFKQGRHAAVTELPGR